MNSYLPRFIKRFGFQPDENQLKQFTDTEKLIDAFRKVYDKEPNVSELNQFKEYYANHCYKQND